MGVLIRYAFLQGKRLFLQLGVFFAAGGILILLLFPVLTAFSDYLSSRLSLKEAEVGLVQEGGEDSELKRLETIASSLESVKDYCRLRVMEKEEALEGLETGALQAVVLLPPDFYEDVMTGVNTPARILIPGDSPFSSGVFQELLLDGSSLIATAEAGIYSAENVYTVHGGVMSRRDMEYFLTERFTKAALNRAGFFDEEELYSAGETDFSTFYTAAFLLLIMLCMSALPRFFYSPPELALEEQLTLKGLPLAASRLVKLVFLFLAELVFFALLFLLVFPLLPGKYPSADRLACLLLPMLGCCLFADMFFRLLGQSTGVLAILLGGLSMCFLGGALIPRVFLPGPVAELGSFLPASLWISDLAAGLRGRALPEVWLQLVWLALFWLAGSFGGLKHE